MASKKDKIKISIAPEIKAELEYMVSLHVKYGAVNQKETIDGLISCVLTAIAEGSRRPGSWEREMLVQMGLVADTEEHEIYRHHYGFIEQARPNQGIQLQR